MFERLKSRLWTEKTTSYQLINSAFLSACFVSVLLAAPVAFAQDDLIDEPLDASASVPADESLTAVEMDSDPVPTPETEVIEDSASADSAPSDATPLDTTPVDIAPLTDDPLGDQVEDLKQSVLDLNRDLLILEEELLFPANTQITVFLSMDVGEFFQLDSVKVHIDDDLVASEIYTEHQIDALYRGGVQRLYIGNLRAGVHEITAFFTGIGPEGREYKRGSTITLEKELEPKMLELKIVDSTKKLQPVFEIKEWQL